MKPTITALLLLCMQISFAQQEQADSLKPAVELNEVVVLEQAAAGSELSFYKSNRQDGVENIMQRMAGVNLIRRGNYAPDVTLHGMASGRIAVTIDGMQVFGACTDRMDPTTSYVETNNLKSVSKTGDENSSGCHSANIAGGVDLKMKDPVFGGGWSGMFGGGYAVNGGGYNGLFNTAYANKKLAINVNAIYRKTGNYADGNGNEVLYSQFEKINFATNIRYRVQENQIARFDIILDNAYNVGYAALPMDVAFAKAQIFGASYQWFLKGFLEEVQAKAYYNFINHAMDDSQRPDVPIRMDMPGQSETYGGFLEAKTKSFNRQKMYVKAEAFSNFRHAEMTMYPPNSTEPPMFMLTWPDVRKTSALIFVQDDIAIGKKDKLTLSARLQTDYNEVISEDGKSYLIPFGYEGPSTYILPAFDATFVKSITPKSSASAHVGYTSRGPTTSEQYAFYLFNAYDGYDYIGNPTIIEEQAFKADLVVKQGFKKWLAEVNVYGYHINNYILGITNPDYDGMTIGANGVRVYDNVGFANMYGVDFTLNGEITRWLAIMGKVGYTRGIMTNNENVPLMPPVNGLLSFKANFKGYEMMFESEFASEQDKVNAIYGDVQTSAYLVNNLRALKSYAIGNHAALSVEAGIDNMFNVAYRNHLDWGSILRPGRNFYIQLKYGF